MAVKILGGEVVFFHQSLKALAFNARYPGGLRYIAIAFFEAVRQKVPFEFFDDRLLAGIETEL